MLILKPDVKKLVMNEKILIQKSDRKNFNLKTRCKKVSYQWKNAMSLNWREKL